MSDPAGDGTVLAKGVGAEAFGARAWPAKVQLVDGAVVVDTPGPAHQEVAERIFAALVTFTTGHAGRGVAGMGLEVAVSPNNVYTPDVWWVRDGRPDAAARPVRLDAAPDIAVEVRSPATWRFDSGTKRRRYGEAGTAELWLVDHQAGKVIVHWRTEGSAAAGSAAAGSGSGGGFDATRTIPVGEILLSPLLPGFLLDLNLIFRP